MKHVIITFLLLVCAGTYGVQAQELHFGDTIKAYNRARIITNIHGMQFLGAFGAANAAAGGIGYFTAKQDEWKYFHEMNAAWGIVNTGIAIYGLSRASMQAKEKLNYKTAYNNYKRDKRIFLINIGLDAAYVAAGAGLVQYANTDKSNPARFRGFGKSIVMQGVSLLIFDNIMYRAHLKYNSRWAQILDEMSFTGNGIGFNYTIQPRKLTRPTELDFQGR